MRQQHKTFRVEQCGNMLPLNGQPVRGDGEAGSTADFQAGLRQDEILAELKALRVAIDSRAAPVDAFQQQFTEFLKLKGELDVIQDAILRTKQEIATIHTTGFNGVEMGRVSNELGAVVGGTEQATQAILSAVEDIDQMANTLAAAMKNEHEKALAQDIQDRVIQIFEACNFQDLTGQRVGKVVTTLRFIEEHIDRMITIWGGIDALKDFSADPEGADDEPKLLNGPKLDGDPGHVSQDDIDALFN
jgi:chemotaxis protein CheZ